MAAAINVLSTPGQGRRAVALALFITLFPNSIKAATCSHVATQLEEAVFTETNQLRVNPPAFAKHLEAIRNSYRGRARTIPGGATLLTSEGVRALDEAITALRSSPPVPALRWDPCLAQSAFDHARDIGPKGLTAHESSHGASFSDRIEHYSGRHRQISENISFGSPTARDVVMDLVIDDGVHGRGHRRNLLDPESALTGVGCGPHASYGTACVMDYSTADRPTKSTHSHNPVVPPD